MRGVYHPKPLIDKLALIGVGASGLYLLQNLLADAREPRGGRPLVWAVTVFDRNERPGMGMPYHPATTDHHNLCNISSVELPDLPDTFADWLRRRDPAHLARFGLSRGEIDDGETYPRVLLGEYLEAQFDAVADGLRSEGIDVTLRGGVEVRDVRPDGNGIAVVTHGGEEAFDRVVVATGHTIATEDDQPAGGYFATPWPIGKLLPADGEVYDFEVGTLGASLSAFDVVSSLAHRHGTFEPAGDGGLRFVPRGDAPDFRVTMHSAEGWLPHLQYEQREPVRKVYRHAGRDEILALRDDAGFLRLGDYFDRVCRPALAEALRHDGRGDVADRLEGGMSLEELVEAMEDHHTYDDPFDGMRRELPEARASVEGGRPIRWMEVLDDLMYALNYHAELMPAEDHLRFREVVQPLLMNVIAALPLASARVLLALRDAGRLDLVRGRVSVPNVNGVTRVEIDDSAHGGPTTVKSYRLFVDCSGQESVTIDDYPFRSLVDAGVARGAEAGFAGEPDVPDQHKDRLTDRGTLRLDGLMIDAVYRPLGRDGEPDRRLHDVAFPHATGLRPYSYGLQACNHTTEMVTAAWREEADDDAVATDVEQLTELQALAEA